MEQHQLGKNKEQGFVSMLLVIVITAVGIFIALSIFSNSNLFSEGIISFEDGQKAKALANACIEDGLQRIRDNSSVSGSYNLTIGGGSCSYVINNVSPTDIIISSTGIFKESTRTVTITINQTTPQILINTLNEGL
ncbi:MAG: hypothetical protein PHW52_01230 [Candidatus Pacebacteria bacterium]|nr:hypothetical protein [Candidatus Paceibacterota bacterium]